MILLHIEYDGVVCNVIMKHANRVNSVLCIDFFPFKMNCNVCTLVVDSGAMNVQSFLVC